MNALILRSFALNREKLSQLRSIALRTIERKFIFAQFKYFIWCKYERNERNERKRAQMSANEREYLRSVAFVFANLYPITDPLPEPGSEDRVLQQGDSLVLCICPDI